MANQVPVGVFSLESLFNFFFSVENAKALANATDGKWETTDLGGFMNNAYAALGRVGWEAPGTHVVTIGRVSRAEVLRAAKATTLTFLDRTHRSPGEGGLFAHHKQQERVAALAKITGMINASRAINGDIAREAQAAAREMANIQFATTVAAAGISLALTFGGSAPMVVGSAGRAAFQQAAGGGMRAALGAGARGMIQRQVVTGAVRGRAAIAGLAGGAAGNAVKDYVNESEMKIAPALTTQPIKDAWGVNMYKMIAVESVKKLAEVGLGMTAAGKAHAHVGNMQDALIAAQMKVKQLNAAVGKAIDARARTAARVNVMSGKVQQHMAERGLQAAHGAAARTAIGSVRGAVSTGMVKGLPIIAATWDVLDGMNDLRNTYADTE